MAFSVKDWRTFTHPIILTAIYLIFSFCYSVFAYEIFLALIIFVWLIFLFNVGLVSLIIVNIPKSKSRLLNNLVAYLVWALAIATEFFVFKRYFQKQLEYTYFLTLFPVGLVTVLLYTYKNLELNILALGSFATFLYFLSFGNAGFAIVLAIILFLLALYSISLLKGAFLSNRQILISFFLGVIIYALSFLITKFCVNFYFAHLFN